MRPSFFPFCPATRGCPPAPPESLRELCLTPAIPRGINNTLPEQGEKLKAHCTGGAVLVVIGCAVPYLMNQNNVFEPLPQAACHHLVCDMGGFPSGIRLCFARESLSFIEIWIERSFILQQEGNNGKSLALPRPCVGRSTGREHSHGSI